MRVADSHEFIELYRGDKDLRLGFEMVRQDESLEYYSIAPNRCSPNDRERFGCKYLEEVGLPPLPERFHLSLLPSLSIRFARKETGGIFSLMRGYYGELARIRPDVILENPFSWLTPRSYTTYAFAHKYCVPVVYYDPGDDIPVSPRHRIMALWESGVVRAAAAIITYNDAGKQRFMRKYAYPEHKIHVIPKPVDVRRCRHRGPVDYLRASFGARPDDVVVMYVGRLAKYKGSSVLLEVAGRALNDDRMRNVRFVFVGDALASDESRDAYALPNTHVTGMVPQSEVPKYLAAGDIIVFPDVTKPGGFPTAVAEAMAAGRALVVGIGNRTEFLPLRHMQTAWLVPPRDSLAIEAAIGCLVADRRRIHRLGAAVGEYARRHMDYRIVAERYLEIIRGVVNG